MDESDSPGGVLTCSLGIGTHQFRSAVRNFRPIPDSFNIVAGAMVATSLIVWPAAPFFLFMKGKDIAIPQGTEITVFVDGDMHLEMSKFGSTGAAEGSGAQTSLSIDSTPAGADIEVDGNFIGSTPSSLPVSLGNHEIAVRKRGYSTWSRHMNVTGGSVHLSAELKRGR